MLKEIVRVLKEVVRVPLEAVQCKLAVEAVRVCRGREMDLLEVVSGLERGHLSDCRFNESACREAVRLSIEALGFKYRP